MLRGGFAKSIANPPLSISLKKNYFFAELCAVAEVVASTGFLLEVSGAFLSLTTVAS